jgi:hypothetical protein
MISEHTVSNPIDALDISEKEDILCYNHRYIEGIFKF